MRTLLPAIAMLAATALAFAAPAATPPVPAFTAHYRLLRNGAPMGVATLTLTRDAGDGWTFTTDTRGTSGLASALGASTREVSRFHWSGDLPQGDSYTYTLKTAFKDKQRHVTFDWPAQTIRVDDHGTYQFPTQPGALERHTIPLALAAGLRAGQQQFTLPIAVRDRIEMQHYAVQAAQSVQVPAGNFDATRVARTDGGDGITAWFAPGKLPAPVKIEQRGKDDYALLLESWSSGG